jgi:hypothetical protein
MNKSSNFNQKGAIECLASIITQEINKTWQREVEEFLETFFITEIILNDNLINEFLKIVNLNDNVKEREFELQKKFYTFIFKFVIVQINEILQRLGHNFLNVFFFTLSPKKKEKVFVFPDWKTREKTQQMKFQLLENIERTKTHSV